MKANFAVVSGSKNYQVNFIQTTDELLNKLAAINDVIIVADQFIKEFYPDLTAKLISLANVFFMAATEENKSLAGIEAIIDFFQAQNTMRSTTVVIIGGGVTQDTVMFAAHMMCRGLRVVLVPTTLLSMCDSCIGGKCGVNYRGFKNQLGAIHPPEEVIIWSGFLATLPQKETHSGYGEILKIALLNGPTLYQNLKDVLSKDGFNNTELSNYIYHGLLLKRQLVEEDEFDVGVRRLLNYGHTFGHALEGITDYALPHGVAVAHGIDLVNYLACQRGILSPQIYADVHAVVGRYFSYDFSPFNLTGEMLVSKAQKDKKAQHGKNNLVFMEDIGKFRVEQIELDQQVCDILQVYLE